MKTHTPPTPLSLAEENPPTTAPPVGADSLTANPAPLDPQTVEQKQDLDAQRSKPFQLTEENPTGAPPRTVPKGRLISGSVGIGGENHPEDVKAIAQRLEALGIITPKEGSATLGDPASIGQHIQRYQQQVFNTVNDGLITPGGATENKLIQGVTTKAQKGEKPAPKAPEKPAQPEHDWKAAAQKIVASGAPAATLGQTLATAHAPAQLVAEVYPLLAENSTDNFAAAYCQALTDAQLAALPQPLKIAFMQSMATGFVTPDEVLQVVRLKNTIGGGKAEQIPDPAKVQGKEEKEIPLKSIGDYIIGPVLSQKQYLSQAPNFGKKRAAHSQTLTTEQLFRNALAKYGPGGDFDIKDPEKRAAKKGIGKGTQMTYEAALEKVHWLGCFNTCELMVQSAGAAPDTKNAVTTLLQDSKTKATNPSADFAKGVSMVDKELLAGRPVMAGVDVGTIGLNYDASDHFIVIVGKVKQGNKVGYCYFDPGTGQPKGWDLSQNILWYGEDRLVNENGFVQNGAGAYQLSRVIPNK